LPEKPKKQVVANSDFNIDSFLHQHLGPHSSGLYADLHRELDRYSLARVLTYTRGNQHMASRLLGIARQTLRLKLRDSGIHVTNSIESQDEEPVSVS
jgi:DNA-binding protein Fis